MLTKDRFKASQQDLIFFSDTTMNLSKMVRMGTII